MVFCEKENWNDQKEITIFEGDSGEWGTEVVLCDPGNFVTGMSVRYNDYMVLSDNTALNGLSLYCRDPYKHGLATKTKTVEWGNWGLWKPKKSTGQQFICGAEVRYDDLKAQGSA